MTIRPARPEDLAAITAIVDEAYGPYVARLGRKPMPMLDDHAARIRDGQAWVAEVERRVAGVLVLLHQDDHALLDNVAVAAAMRGTGVGRALLEFAEAEAARRGHEEVRLYTHETMVENIALYGRIGYREAGRTPFHGGHRVDFHKKLPRGHRGEIPG